MLLKRQYLPIQACMQSKNHQKLWKGKSLFVLRCAISRAATITKYCLKLCWFKSSHRCKEEPEILDNTRNPGVWNWPHPPPTDSTEMAAPKSRESLKICSFVERFSVWWLWASQEIPFPSKDWSAQNKHKKTGLNSHLKRNFTGQK